MKFRLGATHSKMPPRRINANAIGTFRKAAGSYSGKTTT